MKRVSCKYNIDSACGTQGDGSFVLRLGVCVPSRSMTFAPECRFRPGVSPFRPGVDRLTKVRTGYNFLV